MARKQTLEVVREEGLERIVVAAVSKVGVLVPPWLLAAVLTVVAAISHAVWGKAPAVTWTTLAATLATVLLTMLTWGVTHHRGVFGRTHSTLTTLCAGLWFTVANITGITQQVTLGMLFFGGGTLALGWNIRTVIRNSPTAAATGDPLKFVFDQAKASFGLAGASVRTTEVTDHKIKATMALPAGEKIADDVIKKAPYVESGLRFPPGSVQVAQNADDASKVHFTVTDPRVMNRPIPWPGPSRPGGSIAEPLRIGVFQDAEPVEPILPGSNLQIMGASGSGKSIGGAWNIVGESVTRRDAAVFGVDISKDEQTLGPARPALHRFETTKAGAVAFIRKLYELIPKRTAWLAEHGFSDWEEGCGLTYWVVLLEECHKLYNQLGSADVEKLEEIHKEIRSAGGRVIDSLQKAIYSEMPTIIRSQMSFMCFGLNDSADAQYGLSEAQQRGECAPELWGAGKPEHVGKAYLDFVGIPETHITMPLRTYMWGPTKQEARANFAAHCAQYPAADKQVDEFTRQLADPSGSAARPDQPTPLPGAGTAAPASAEKATDDQSPTPDAAPTRDADDFVDLLAEAAELVILNQYASTTMIQRKLRLSHAECLRVMEALERKDIVGPPTGDDGKREVLVSAEDGEKVVKELQEAGDAAGEHLRTEDPSPEISASPYDDVQGPTVKEDRFHVVGPDGTDKPGRKLPPEQARALVHDWIRERAGSGRTTFTATDEELTRVRQQTGNSSRGWTYKVLDELVSAGVLTDEGEGRDRTFTIADLQALETA